MLTDLTIKYENELSLKHRCTCVTFGVEKIKLCRFVLFTDQILSVASFCLVNSNLNGSKSNAEVSIVFIVFILIYLHKIAGYDCQRKSTNP